MTTDTPTPGKRLVESAREAVSIAKGEQPAARITINGHSYVPEEEFRTLSDKLARVEEELAHLKTSGIIEVAVRNPSVMDYMRHWEARAEAAEASLAIAEKVIEPFAREAEYWSGYDDSEMVVEAWPGGPASCLNVGDLRAARDFKGGRDGK